MSVYNSKQIFYSTKLQSGSLYIYYSVYLGDAHKSLSSVNIFEHTNTNELT